MFIKHTCPECGAELNAAINPSEPTLKAKPGDFTICLECCSLCVFEDDLSLRRPTREELENSPDQLAEQKKVKLLIDLFGKQRINRTLSGVEDEVRTKSQKIPRKNSEYFTWPSPYLFKNQ